MKNIHFKHLITFFYLKFVEILFVKQLLNIKQTLNENGIHVIFQIPGVYNTLKIPKKNIFFLPSKLLKFIVLSSYEKSKCDTHSYNLKI